MDGCRERNDNLWRTVQKEITNTNRLEVNYSVIGIEMSIPILQLDCRERNDNLWMAVERETITYGGLLRERNDNLRRSVEREKR